MQSSWSETLVAQTKEALETQGMDLVPTPDGRVHFKNLDGRYGSMPLSLLLGGQLEITDKRSGDIESFSTPEAVIASGWGLD